jgi:predicted alpha/beta hydrolase family esterase
MLVVYIVFSFMYLGIWSLQIGWFKRFQNLIEEAVDRNHGQPAVLIAHSMGNLVTYYFVKQVLRRLLMCVTSFYLVLSASSDTNIRGAACEVVGNAVALVADFCCLWVQMEADPSAELSSWTHRHVAGLISLAAPW